MVLDSSRISSRFGPHLIRPSTARRRPKGEGTSNKGRTNLESDTVAPSQSWLEFVMGITKQGQPTVFS